ncbi:MAG: hypothetical protein EHM35_06970, partial [Planctomycetaceae bacterium]
MFKNSILAGVLIISLGTLALAAVPQTVNYQGYLKNTDGTPVNTAVNVTFSLYSSNPARNNPVWLDTRSVTPANGVYSVVLGQAKPITAPFDAPYWLGVQVQSDPEMTPLQPLAASPYAFRAATADSVGSGALADGSVSTTKLADGSVTAVKLADGAVTDAKISGTLADARLSANVALLNAVQSVTGAKTFSAPISSTVPTGTAPLEVASTTLVPNFNAEMVGGKKLVDLDSRYINSVNPVPTAQQIATLRWYQVRSGDLTVAVSSYPYGLAFDGTSIWVTNGLTNNVMKLDPATGAILGTYAVGAGAGPKALAFDGASVWVANSNSNSVRKINPATGAVGTPITVGAYPSALAFDGTSVWVANSGSNSVQKIDPATGTAGTPIAVGTGPSALAFDGRNIWVANRCGNSVQKIDPATGVAGAPIAVGTGPSALAFDGSMFWVANSHNNCSGGNGQGTLQKINPATGTAGIEIPLGFETTALVFDGTNIWVGNLGGQKVLRFANAGVPVGVRSVDTA